MAEFDPVAVLRVLNSHEVEFVVVGGVAARLRGAPLLTQDVDITPQTTEGNMVRLARALEALGAKLRTADEPDGVAFPFDPHLLKESSVWTLTTPLGDLDLVIAPAGFDGFDESPFVEEF